MGAVVVGRMLAPSHVLHRKLYIRLPASLGRDADRRDPGLGNRLNCVCLPGGMPEKKKPAVSRSQLERVGKPWDKDLDKTLRDSEALLNLCFYINKEKN